MKQHFTTLLLAVVSVFSLSLSAQSVNDRTLFVRFKAGTAVSENKGTLIVNGDKLTIETAGIWRTAHSMNRVTLDSLRHVAENNLGKQLPDLSLDYRFTVDDAAGLQKAIQELDAHPAIFSAKRAPKVFNAAAPNFQNFQIYLKNAQTGINAEAVWSVYNNHGEGIKVCDLEYDFNSTHLDLPNVTIIGPAPVDPFEDGAGINHGTAVLGEIGGLNDGIGVTGIAYGSTYYFGGTYYNDMYQLEAALLETMLHLDAGDVVLIEQQIDGPLFDPDAGNQYGLIPVEWVQEFYDAIQLIVGQGIIVVEAAGNGQQNLDDPIYQQDNSGHYPFLPGNGSGAIVVGAGAVDSDVERSTMWYSNHGVAVEIQGNGESIYTTGYGDLFNQTGDELYTSHFGGTSGASPIVTGAVALLNATYFQETGGLLTRDQIVNIFKLTGQPQNNGSFSVAEAHIGPLPNIKAAIDYALSSASLTENDSPSLLAYPNPAAGNVVVNCPADQLLQLSDIMGNSVPFISRELTNGYTLLVMEELPSGIYFLQTLHGNASQTVKISLN